MQLLELMPVLAAAAAFLLAIAVAVGCAMSWSGHSSKKNTVVRAALDVGVNQIRLMVARVARSDGSIVGDPIYTYNGKVELYDEDGGLIGDGMSGVNVVVALVAQARQHGAKELVSVADDRLLRGTDFAVTVQEHTSPCFVRLLPPPLDTAAVAVTAELKSRHGELYRCAAFLKDGEPVPLLSL